MSTTRERFDAKWVPEPNTGCWLWTAADTGRYGYFRLDGKVGQRRSIGANRAAWLLYRGPIPEGMMVCHTCDTPICVNPDHLFLGTPLDNMLDKVAKGRQVSGQSRKTRCPRGHPYDATNTRHYNYKGQHYRYCRICCNESSRKHKARKRALLEQAKS